MTILNPFWGTDLLIKNRDLSVNSGGDLALVTGDTNLQQALTDRLITELGFLNEDPTYGTDIDSFIGQRDLDATIQLIEIATSNSLLADPRVANIVSISIYPIGQGSYSITSQVSVYGSFSPLNINFVTPYRITSPQAPLPNSVNFENQVSLSRTQVRTQYSIYQILSVFLQADTTGTFGDFFAGGSVGDHLITLGTPLPSDSQAVLVSYLTLDDIRGTDVYEHVGLERGSIVNLNTVSTAFPIKCVIGVYIVPDENSKNYLYTPNGFLANTPPGPIPSYNTLTLGTSLPVGTNQVYISYLRLIAGS